MVDRAVIHVLVKQFYERNTGLFLFIFFLLFGIVESSQIVYFHLSLIYGILEAPVFFALVAGIWLLYSLKTLQFADAQLRRPENTFLFELGKLPASVCFRTMLFTQVLVYIPVLLYSLAVLGVAVYTQKWWPALALIVLHTLLLSTSAAIISHVLRHQHRPTAWWPVVSLRWPYAKPSVWFLLGSLPQQHGMVLLMSKFFSLLCLLGFLQLDVGAEDARVPMLGLCFGLAAHAVVTFELRRHEDRHLIFWKGLPISLPMRFARLLLLYGLILLPEILLLAVNRVSVPALMSCLIIGISYLVYTHVKLYNGSLNMERHINRNLLLFLLAFLVVLSKVFWLGAAVALALAWHSFRKNYYRYEPLG